MDTSPSRCRGAASGCDDGGVGSWISIVKHLFDGMSFSFFVRIVT